MIAAFILPIEVKSEANGREHWRKKSARIKQQRSIAQMVANAHCPRAAWADAPHVRVSMTRIYGGRSRAFDSDNLAGAFKAIRDGIAAALGVDDGADWYTWETRQERDHGLFTPYVMVRVVATKRGMFSESMQPGEADHQSVTLWGKIERITVQAKVQP